VFVDIVNSGEEIQQNNGFPNKSSNNSNEFQETVSFENQRDGNSMNLGRGKGEERFGQEHVEAGDEERDFNTAGSAFIEEKYNLTHITSPTIVPKLNVDMDELNASTKYNGHGTEKEANNEVVSHHLNNDDLDPQSDDDVFTDHSSNQLIADGYETPHNMSYRWRQRPHALMDSFPPNWSNNDFDKHSEIALTSECTELDDSKFAIETTHVEQRDNNDGQNPNKSFVVDMFKADIYVPTRPTTTHSSRPTTTHSSRPTTTHSSRPTTTHSSRPTTTHSSRPTTTHSSRPTTTTHSSVQVQEKPTPTIYRTTAVIDVMGKAPSVPNEANCSRDNEAAPELSYVIETYNNEVTLKLPGSGGAHVVNNSTEVPNPYIPIHRSSLDLNSLPPINQMEFENQTDTNASEFISRTSLPSSRYFCNVSNNNTSDAAKKSTGPSVPPKSKLRSDDTWRTQEDGTRDWSATLPRMKHTEKLNIRDVNENTNESFRLVNGGKETYQTGSFRRNYDSAVNDELCSRGLLRDQSNSIRVDTSLNEANPSSRAREVEHHRSNEQVNRSGVPVTNILTSKTHHWKHHAIEKNVGAVKNETGELTTNRNDNTTINATQTFNVSLNSLGTANTSRDVSKINTSSAANTSKDVSKVNTTSSANTSKDVLKVNTAISANTSKDVLKVNTASSANTSKDVLKVNTMSSANTNKDGSKVNHSNLSSTNGVHTSSLEFRSNRQSELKENTPGSTSLPKRAITRVIPIEIEGKSVLKNEGRPSSNWEDITQLNNFNSNRTTSNDFVTSPRNLTFPRKSFSNGENIAIPVRVVRTDQYSNRNDQQTLTATKRLSNER